MSDSSIDCCIRDLRLRINIIYMDYLSQINCLQNEVIHNSFVPYIKNYFHYNNLFDMEKSESSTITADNLNIIYFTCECPVELKLTCDDQTTILITSEFYLYQPTKVFSIEISFIDDCKDLDCQPYLHLFYGESIDGQNNTSIDDNPGTPGDDDNPGTPGDDDDSGDDNPGTPGDVDPGTPGDDDDPFVSWADFSIKITLPLNSIDLNETKDDTNSLTLNLKI